MNHVLITGGTGLIGKEIVKGFLSKKIKITFTTTSQKKGEMLCDLLGGNKLLNFKVVTFRNERDIDDFIADFKSEGFSHLINNARSLDSLSLNADGYANNNGLSSEFFMAVTLSYLLSVGFKSSLKIIINISSMYGIVPPNKHLYEDGYSSSPIQYGIAKAAQIQLSKELCVRFADEGIRVNTISFGGFEGRVNDDFKNRYAKLCPQGKMLSIDKVFPSIWFLASSDSDGMTGHNLVIDGGWSVW